MITISNSTQLQTEYFPTIIWNLPIKTFTRFVLFEFIVLERKHKKNRGNWFEVTIDTLATKFQVSERAMKSYVQELKTLNIIEMTRNARFVKYRINWTKIGVYGSENDLYKQNNNMNENLIKEESVEPAIVPVNNVEVIEVVQTPEDVEIDEEKDESDIIYDNVMRVVKPSLPRWRAMKTNKMLICKRTNEIQSAVADICQTHQYNLSQRKEVSRIINSLAS